MNLDLGEGDGKRPVTPLVVPSERQTPHPETPNSKPHGRDGTEAVPPMNFSGFLAGKSIHEAPKKARLSWRGVQSDNRSQHIGAPERRSPLREGVTLRPPSIQRET